MFTYGKQNVRYNLKNVIFNFVEHVLTNGMEACL